VDKVCVVKNSFFKPTLSIKKTEDKENLATQEEDTIMPTAPILTPLV
jgi:hypothetical protein